MAAVGTLSINGVITCSMPGCGWTGWVRDDTSPTRLLISHRMADHPATDSRSPDSGEPADAE